MAEVHLYDLISPRDPAAVERDVVALLTAIDDDFDAQPLRTLYRDVVSLFHGGYPGWQASDAYYHDLEHTNTVFLCVAAMLFGAHHDGAVLGARTRFLVLASALFHDVGLIRRDHENGGGTGAQFTIGHERRSIDFMGDYFSANGYADGDIRDAGQLIMCTALNKKIAELDFSSDELRIAGQMLGSADLVAQMADRAYLEKLLLLFREFQEGGVPGYESELDLLSKTPYFFHQVVKKRLEEEFDQVDAFLDVHARVRWGMVEDPFRLSIRRNLEYLERLLEGDQRRYRDWLRRGGVVETLPAEDPAIGGEAAGRGG